MTNIISIIIVNYNGSKDTIECIKSIFNSDYKNINIIVIDNKSYKEDYDRISDFVKDNDKVILIRSNKNLGFAGGNNLGIKKALELKSEYVFLLNNDTLIESNCLEKLKNTCESNKKCGIVAPLICYYPDKNRIWFAGGRFDWKKFVTYHIGENEIDNGQYSSISRTDFITGCAMFIKSDAIRKAGLMPEEYFMYYEDVDYCEIIKNAGYDLMFNGQAKIYHKVSASSGGEQSAFSIEYGTRNRKKFINKYKHKAGKKNYYYGLIYLYITRIIKYFKFTITGQSHKRKAVIKGVIQ